MGRTISFIKVMGKVRNSEADVRSLTMKLQTFPLTSLEI